MLQSLYSSLAFHKGLEIDVAYTANVKVYMTTRVSD